MLKSSISGCSEDVATFDGLKTVEAVPEYMLVCVRAEIGDCLDICQVIKEVQMTVYMYFLTNWCDCRDT